MFFRGQKGTPVKLEFDIFLEHIKPWSSAQVQSDRADIPLLLGWRRGSKRSGITKCVLPSLGGSDGGKVVFNERFKLPVTLFARKSGEFHRKSVRFALLENESAEAVKISRQLASGELDLSQFGGSTATCSTSIPLSTGHRGSQADGDPTLFLTVSSSGRPASYSSQSSGQLPSAGRPEFSRQSSYFLPESDDSDDEDDIGIFTDEEESSESQDDLPVISSRAKALAIKRELLFSPDAIIPSSLIYPNPREILAPTAATSSDGESSGRTFSALKVIGETGNKKANSPKWSEDEKRQFLLRLSEPRKSLAAAVKTLEMAAASAAKSVEAARISMKNTYAGQSPETEAALVESNKAAESEAAAKIEAVEAAAASLDISVVAAAAVYAAKKATLSKGDRPSESSSSALSGSSTPPPESGSKRELFKSQQLNSPPTPSSSLKQADAFARVSGSKRELFESQEVNSPPSPSSSPKQAAAVVHDSGGNRELSESQPLNSPPAPSTSPEQSAKSARDEKANPKQRAPDPQDQIDYKSLVKEAKTKFTMVERRSLEDLRSKVAAAVANEEKGKQIARALEERLSIREDEMRDSAAIEFALYSVAAEHTSSTHKLHTPARRLARLYLQACKHRRQERRASAARNSVHGLIVAVRACGNDLPRLTYWWSNIVVLRESIVQACNNVTPGSELHTGAGATTSGGGDSFADRALRSQQLRRRSFAHRSVSSENLGLKSVTNDWQDWNTYVVALLKVETWVHGRILECAWWQAMAPPMRVGGGDAASRPGSRFMHVGNEECTFEMKMKEGLGELSKVAGDVKELLSSRRSSGINLSKLGDDRFGTSVVEIWKSAFTDAFKRLCPLQGRDAECGCLPVLSRQVIGDCVDRLDAAMLNGIMRNPVGDAPIDPITDPMTNLSVLPIPAGALTFGAGSQLKNAVVTWSTWLSALLSMRESNAPAKPMSTSAQALEEINQRELRFSSLKATDELLEQFSNGVIDMAMRRDAARKEAERASPYFVLLRAAGDLLMLPKEMLMDKAVRKEVCPELKLPLIRRILCNFVADEFAPDPISPALIHAIDKEVSLEREEMQDEVGMAANLEDMAVAPVPVCSYSPPSSAFVRLWIGEPPGIQDNWGKTPSSLLCKGYESDNELNRFLTPLSWLKESPNTLVGSPRVASGIDYISQSVQSTEDSQVYTGRFELLQEIWGPS